MSAAGLTRDGVLVAVALTDANQEGAIFVLGGQQQLLSFQAVYVPIIPPAHKHDNTDQRPTRPPVSNRMPEDTFQTFRQMLYVL